MCDHPVELPRPPDGFQRIGWHGVALILPDTWNLQVHDGTAGGGTFFTDLRASRLEIRWHTPRNSPAGLAAGLNGLRKGPGSQVERLSATAMRLTDHGNVNLVAADDRRVYELHFPAQGIAADPGIVAAISNDFLQMMPLLAGRDQWYWSIYGATGWVRAWSHLAKASLLPGASTLSIAKSRYGGKIITLGAFSMADRLLRQAGSLRCWAAAAIPLIARHPAGRWEESGQSASFTAEVRGLFHLARHKLSLHHDLAGNRIAWNHRLERVFR